MRSILKYLKLTLITLLSLVLSIPVIAQDGTATPEAAVTREAAAKKNAANEASSDWPCYLGPNRDGTSLENGLLRKWPKEGPRQLWRAPIKMGWSCPSVSGNDVYVFMAPYVTKKESERYANNGLEKVVCLDAKTGKMRWETEYKVGVYYCGWFQGGPRGTPLVTERFVYTMGLVGHLTCFNRKTGAIVWQTEIQKEVLSLKQMNDVKGFNQSPVIIDKTIVIMINQSDSRITVKLSDPTIAGFDAETGKLIWKYQEPLREKTCGSDAPTVAVAVVNGEKCALTYINRYLVAIRASDGKVIWRYDQIPAGRRGTPIDSLILYGKNRVLYTPVEAGATRLMSIDWNSPNPAVKIIWEDKNGNFSGNCTTFKYHNGYIWACNYAGFDPNDLNKTFQQFKCVEENTGKVYWESEKWQFPVTYIAADGLLFVRSYKMLRLVEAGSRGYKELGKMENLHEGGRNCFDGPSLIDYVQPVLSNGRLFIRLPDELLCLDVKNP